MAGATAFADRADELLRVFLFTTLLFLLVLPFFSTLLLIRGRHSQRRRMFRVTAWGLAALSVLPLLVSALVLPVNSRPTCGQLWGIWLYIGLAVGALILETLALMVGSRPG